MELEARYIPVPLKLEPRESINSKRDFFLSSGAAKPPLDQGILQVQLLDGGEIHGADRGGMLPPSRTPSIPAHVIDSGKSDPFVVFTLDGQRVFKSQTKKKTIHPEWNETFAVTVVGVTTEYWESPITDYGRYSRLVLQQTSNLKYSTGTRSSRPKAWEQPRLTSRKWSPSAV